MRTQTFSSRTDRMGNRPDLIIETDTDGDQVIVTVGPLGGPFQTVYLTPEQAVFMGHTLAHLGDVQREAVGGMGIHNDPF